MGYRGSFNRYRDAIDRLNARQALQVQSHFELRMLTVNFENEGTVTIIFRRLVTSANRPRQCTYPEADSSHGARQFNSTKIIHAIIE